MFSNGALDEARAVSVLEIAEKRLGVRLKTEGKTRVGPCPVCNHGDDRFIVWLKENTWFCRSCDEGGDVIKLVMRLTGRSFVDTVRELIGEDAGTTRRREPTPEEIAAREAREAQRRRAKASFGRAEEMSAAQIVVAPAGRRRHARRSLSARRPQDRRAPLGDQTGARGRRYTRLVRARLLQSARSERAAPRAQWPMAKAIIKVFDRARPRGRALAELHGRSIHQGPQDQPGNVARRRGAVEDRPPVARRRRSPDESCISAKGSSPRCRRCPTRQ